MKGLLMVAAAATAGLGAASANAALLNDPPPTQEVRYSDLDLTKVSDRLRLKHRLSRAASLLCKEVENAMPVAPIDPICYRMTLQAALQQMDRAIARANGGPELAARTQASPRQ